MKKIITVLAAVLFIPLISYGQRMHHDERGAFKKIEELENIKLINVLGMDETTTLKFFARRTRFREQQGKLYDAANDLLNKLDTTVKSGGKNDKELKNYLGQYWQIQNKILKQREEFFNSLSDILSVKQISELLVFEKRFRDEIRKMFFQERFKRRK